MVTTGIHCTFARLRFELSSAIYQCSMGSTFCMKWAVTRHVTRHVSWSEPWRYTFFRCSFSNISNSFLRNRSRSQAHRPLETVIFSSLSSFLHPKERVESPKERTTAASFSAPLPATMEQTISKSRSQSLFASFRLRHKERVKNAGSQSAPQLQETWMSGSSSLWN